MTTMLIARFSKVEMFPDIVAITLNVQEASIWKLSVEWGA